MQEFKSEETHKNLVGGNANASAATRQLRTLDCGRDTIELVTDSSTVKILLEMAP